uniref:Retrovirus-related Pol polyprotein from transposon TNT 1-94 n=1 Tax=Tanacetum cinerariifolium TaxID=118510 RepID=A0A699GYF2_TANCI|nr:retrovirus-related Pol polyprotein from transposon TNT 1-94 [Tanacetum cinerariifolium]
MIPFGCPVIILNTIDHLGKFDGKANEGFFVGYFLNSKAFKLFNSKTRIVKENLHIRFSESTTNVVRSGPDWLLDIDVLTRTMNYEPIVAGTQSNGFAEKEDNVNNTNNVNTVSLTVNAAGTNEDNELPFDLNMPSLEDVSIFNFSNDDEDDGIMADINNLDTTIQGNSDKLVAQGHTQEEAIDYYEVFAPVTKIEAIRLFLAYASFKDFVVYQMDVKSSFLYGKIEEEVYVCQPPEFENSNFLDRVYKVKKALYGLHQDPRAWHETLSTYILDNGFQKGKIDKTLFIKRYKGDILLVQVYVDDTIFDSTKKELCNAFEWLMHKKFQMSSIGELTFFLGLQVKQKKDRIFISQDKYVAKILKKFGFIKVTTISAPMETQTPLLKDKNSEEVDVYMYRSMIGSLMYLTSSRPNIMFAVCACARYQVNPKLWSNAMDKTINGEAQLHARVDGKKIIITEASIKRDLQLANEEGFDYLPNFTIFEQLALMGPNTTAWNEFSSTVAFAIICLATSQKFNFSKWIFDDEAVHKELGNSLVRAATIVSSLEAEQDNGGGPRCQEAMRNTTAQTRFESVSKHFNDSLLARGNTPQSDEDRLELNELIALCTTLQTIVLDLEKKKTTQCNDIASLKKRVKKLEKKNRSRTHKLKRLYKTCKRERAQKKQEETNIALIKTWDNIQAKIDADHQLAERSQAQEQEELSDAKKATLFVQLWEKRRKHFEAKRSEEKRNKPPTQAQKRKIMCNYLKNMEGYTLKQLKLKEFMKFKRCLTEHLKG